MSVLQVKQTEEAAQQMILKNEPVYAKDATLATAKAIQGLRAVFGETYPDPVRVVSIGIPVDELLNDPAGPGGSNTSVEFCGGTHLKRSGHIGDFVIASEEAIAKGIRRIIALTGPEATKVVNKADSLEKSVTQLKQSVECKTSSENSKDKIKQIVDLMEEVSQSSISYWKKDELRNNLNNLKKQLDDAERAGKAAVLNHVVETAKSLAEQLNGSKFIVSHLNAGSNAKALDAALKQVRTSSPNTAAIFFSTDADAGKIICLASVPPDAVAQGLKANEWIQQITKTINGKGGGKPEAAQATGTNINSLNEAISLSLNFAKLKLRESH